MDRLLALPKSLEILPDGFASGAAIPREFTCQGENVSFGLEFRGVPSEARFLALVMDDPDAPGGTFTHWTFWDLPSTLTRLPRRVDVTDHDAVEGRNDFGDVGYGGPCPPSGTHRYFVRVFALREPLGLKRGASVREVARALAGKAVAWGETMGTYAKS